MSYAEADLLEREQIVRARSVPERQHLYASPLSPEAQAVIGKVGAQTKGVEKMLRRVGFRYAKRIDPFDGGAPYFIAPVDEITAHLRHEARPRRKHGAEPDAPRALIGRDLPEGALLPRRPDERRSHERRRRLSRRRRAESSASIPAPRCCCVRCSDRLNLEPLM